MLPMRHSVSVGLLLTAVVLVMIWAVPLRAQHLTRNLTGTVTDRQHEPLRGAVVEVHSEATGTIVSYITTETGEYSFKRLEGDLDYTVWATWRGRRSGTKKLSLFDISKAKVINLEVSEPR